MSKTGGHRVILNFANQLSKFGHEVSITTLKYDNWFNLSPEIRIYNKGTEKFNLF